MEWGGVVGEPREAAWRKTLSREEMEGNVSQDMNGSETMQGKGRWKREGWSKAEGHVHCNHKGRLNTECAATWALTARCSSHAWNAAVHTEDLHRIWYCSLTRRQQQNKAPAQTLCSHQSQLASSKQRRHPSYKSVTATGTPGPPICVSKELRSTV